MKKLTLIIIFIVGTLKAQQLYAKSDINYSAVYNKILQLGIKFPDFGSTAGIFAPEPLVPKILSHTYDTLAFGI